MWIKLLYERFPPSYLYWMWHLTVFSVMVQVPENVELPFLCHYSQVHSDPEWEGVPVRAPFTS